MVALKARRLKLTEPRWPADEQMTKISHPLIYLYSGSCKEFTNEEEDITPVINLYVLHSHVNT